MNSKKKYKEKMAAYIKHPTTRPRRNRKAKWSRALVSQNILTPSDLIQPIFIQEGENKRDPIDSMPGVYRVSIDIAVGIARQARELGISAIALFPKIDFLLKTHDGKEAYNPENLVCRAIMEIKEKVDGIGIIADVALDPYTTHGHDGLADENGYVLNDETVEHLCKQALVSAQAGCDIIAPSDMMDGRIGKIRNMLEEEGFINTQIMSYSVKYASQFYGPFRDAVGSRGLLGKTDKKNYYSDFSNASEILDEVRLDIGEGADMVIIKPGMPYLDLIRSVSDKYNTPVIAYQVSGEYSMLKIAAEKGIFDWEEVMYESLIGFKRAGARAIFTYSAVEIAEYLSGL